MEGIPPPLMRLMFLFFVRARPYPYRCSTGTEAIGKPCILKAFANSYQNTNDLSVANVPLIYRRLPL